MSFVEGHRKESTFFSMKIKVFQFIPVDLDIEHSLTCMFPCNMSTGRGVQATQERTGYCQSFPLLSQQHQVYQGALQIKSPERGCHAQLFPETLTEPR